VAASNPGLRRGIASAPGLLILICAVAALSSDWTIGIPQAHFAEGFGFQNAFCWVALASALGAIVTGRAAVLLVGEASLLAWFGWAMWVVTSPAFARLPWPFVGIDVVGSGWYAAGLAILIAAAALVVRSSAGPWLFAAIPGFGVARLGRVGRGAIWTTLFVSALLLAAFSSPDMSQFDQFRNYASLPPAPSTRLPTWILLVTALVIWGLSVIDTARITAGSRPVRPRLVGASTHPRERNHDGGGKRA
jgi:hypothetical protein